MDNAPITTDNMSTPMSDNPYKTGSDLAKAFWPLIMVIFSVAIAWSSLNTRVQAVEVANESIQGDVKWLRANTYNLLIKQGVNPVNP